MIREDSWTNDAEDYAIESVIQDMEEMQKGWQAMKNIINTIFADLV